jgi:serine/threonine-protein kinase
VSARGAAVPSRERWGVLAPLLDAALELRPTRRATFVYRACGDDETLRAEVEQLLAACERSDALLRTPAAVAYGALLDVVPPRPAVPRLLAGRYRIVRELGRGGAATVYLAHDRRRGRRVAVKVLHDVPGVPSVREQFAREIEIAASLSHPHLLPLYDSGVDADLPYHVSPCVDGGSLRERLLRAPRPGAAEARRLAEEAAWALDHAHRQGVIHLDVKPGNILLHRGHAVVADFGIARTVRSPERLPAGTARLLGTPAYMSPEQAAGAPDLDGRSDVYSLGCVLYELLAGVPAFGDGSLSAALARSRVATWPDPAPLHARAPRALAAIVMRAMEPAREDRYRTAAEMARALRVSAARAGSRSGFGGGRSAPPGADGAPDSQSVYVRARAGASREVRAGRA